MTSCRHHSGYLADDEAGHTTYVARLPKKPLFPGMGQAAKLGHTPHPSSRYTPTDSLGLRGHRRNPRDPQPFAAFLDFLVEGQVLDSLQTVVEEATERMTAMKTEAGVPLVEVQDPIEVPRGGRRARARPSLSTVHRHRARPSLCTGQPNNYPSSSSSMSDSHSCFTAGCRGSHSWDSDLGARGMGSLPPMRDRLLLEKNLKRLLKLENRGKGLGPSCFRRDSLLWNSLASQSSSQWTQEPPQSWFSGLLDSNIGTPQTSEPGSGEQDLTFLKQEFNKEIKSLLNQPVSFDLPGYCSFREPHQTLDFLAEHHLFPALQSVVRQAVDKLSGACRHNGCPLFPSEWEPATDPNSDSATGSKPATPTDGEDPYDVLPRVSSSKTDGRKSTKGRGQGKPKEGGSPVSSAQVATKYRIEVKPTEESKVPSPHPRQESPDQNPEEHRPPIPSSGPLSSSQKAHPWRSLHLTLPVSGIVVEGSSSQTQPTIRGITPLIFPYPGFSHRLPVFSPLASSSPTYKFTKKKPLPSISSNSSTSHLSNPLYEELVSYLVDQVVSLLTYKYKFEKNLSKKLGFISFPVTEMLMDLFLGFRKVEDSHIGLSPKIDWSCLQRRLEQAEWAQQLSRHTSQHDSSSQRSSHRRAPHHKAPHHKAPHHRPPHSSTESPSTLLEPGPQVDQEEAMESSLNSEFPGSQLLPDQEDTPVGGQEPTSQQEPKPSMFSGTSTGSNKHQEVLHMDSQSEEEEEGEDEDEDFLGDNDTSQSYPGLQVEVGVTHSTNVSRSDPP
ncbi:coiled-coil domain-containing protein 116 isoform X1 [Lontra canadensis]|uniref:coiled-coil domain-containing protein 116 isoform X1 n=1 Tax=Lontra canadensis TaxID=76717 RepID=UPI0013F2DEE3|nr:coiled-coil domain-containing protein 116 isoform X1 [Lontra canadensis]